MAGRIGVNGAQYRPQYSGNFMKGPSPNSVELASKFFQKATVSAVGQSSIINIGGCGLYSGGTWLFKNGYIDQLISK